MLNEAVEYPWIYHNKGEKLISMSADLVNWYTIRDRNLWASNTDITSIDCRWNYYQWGNWYWWATPNHISSTSTTKVDTTGYWPWNYYSNSTFIYDSNGWWWSSVDNRNLWGWESQTITDRQWPCDTGFHIPTMAEWMTIFGVGATMWAWTVNWNTISWDAPLYLLLYYAQAYYDSISWEDPSSGWGNPWLRCSSSNSTDNWQCILINSINSISTQPPQRTTWGYWVRPFKDTPVVPDKSRFTLYQNTN